MRVPHVADWALAGAPLTAPKSKQTVSIGSGGVTVAETGKKPEPTQWKRPSEPPDPNLHLPRQSMTAHGATPTTIDSLPPPSAVPAPAVRGLA